MRGIVQAYGQTGNLSQTARMVGVTQKQVRRYYQQHQDEMDRVRNKIAVDIVPTMQMVRRLALEELMDPMRMARAQTKDLAIIIGVLTDKINIILGQPTARIAIQKLSSEVVEQFSAEERAKIRQLREKMLADGTPREVVDGAARFLDSE